MANINKEKEEVNKLINRQYVVVYQAKVPAVYGPFDTELHAKEWGYTMFVSGQYKVVPIYKQMLAC